jgi:hypothetical protein
MRSAQPLTWYIDASKIDGHNDSTQRFGIGILGIGKDGLLQAMATAVPPAYVDTIGHAEAFCIALVL